MKSSKTAEHLLYLFSLVLLALIFRSSDNGLYHSSLTNQNCTAERPGVPTDRIHYKSQENTEGMNGGIPPHIARKQLEFARTLPTVEDVRKEKLAKGVTVQQYGWKQRGPINIGGRTRAIAIDIRDENIILAGSVSGGMWKSTDGGQTWRITTKSHQLQTVTSIVQDIRAGHEDTWYFGTGEYIGHHDGKEGLPGDGIYISTDNGENWILIESTSINTPQKSNDGAFEWVHKLVINLVNPDHTEIFAAVFGSIYRSYDGGENWESVLGGNTRNYGFSDVIVTSAGVVFATLSTGLDQGIWRSENGTDWTKISPVDFDYPAPSFRTVIGIAPSNENVIYFLTDITPTFLGYDVSSSTFWKYTYISGDGSGDGGIWEDRSDKIPGNVDTNRSYCMYVRVYPDDENIVFIGGQELYRSTNGFATKFNYRTIGRSNLMSKGLHVDHHDLIFSKTDPKTAYAVTDGGISKTSDVLSKWRVDWSYSNKGFITTQFYTVSIVPDIAGDKRIMGGLQDNGSYYAGSSDPERDWSFILGGDGTYGAFLNNGTKFLCGMHDGLVFLGDQVQDPAGLPFSNPYLRTVVNPVYNSTPLFISPLLADPNDNKIIYLSGGKELWRNSDIFAIPHNGSQSAKTQNWSVIHTSFVDITALGISRIPANVLYFGTRSGNVYRMDNALSDDPEVTSIYSGKGFPMAAYVSCIAVDPNNGDHAVLSFANYDVKSVFGTWDGGESWTHVSGNLEEYSTGKGNGPAVKWISILKENGSNTYFAGTSTGLYSTRTLDGINTVWAQEGAETIGNVNVTMIAVREADEEVAVATWGKGIFSKDISTGVDDEQPQQPEEFVLDQNYPNPFNPETTISFNLKRPENVSLEVFNTLGQKVRALISNEFRQTGTNFVKFDGLNDSGMRLSSGTYIYRLTAGRSTRSKRMVILK